jgi:hypothetical protein
MNPGVTEAAILSMMALITIRKKPKVTIVKGKVRIFRISPSVAFTNPKTIAAISAATSRAIQSREQCKRQSAKTRH